MNDLLKAAQAVIDDYRRGNPECGPVLYSSKLIEALRQAVEQAKGVEAVAYRIFDGEGDYDYRTELPNAESIAWSARYGRYWEPLYTTPPSVDALIAEIDGLSPSHVNDEYGCKHSDTLIMYHACDIKAILDKYRGKP